MKKLIMFLSVLGMFSVGSVWAQTTGNVETKDCGSVNDGTTRERKDVSGSSPTVEGSQEDVNVNDDV